MLFLPVCESAKERLQVSQCLATFIGEKGLCGLQLRLESGLKHRPLAQALLCCYAAQQARLFVFCELPTLS
jgi:hypothetical protein